MISKKSKVLAALSLSIVIGLGSNVFAATKSTSRELKKTNNMVEVFKDKKVLVNDGFDKLAEKLGLTKDDINSGMKSGKSILDLAKEKGYTLEQVREALVEIRTESINKAVADGKITQEKADELIIKVKEQIAKWDGSGKHFIINDKNKVFGHLSQIEVLGLTKEDVADGIKSGKTIFDLAKEKKDMTPEQVKAALIKAETEKINKMVTEGKMTQEKADAMISKAKERIEKWDGSLKPSKPFPKEHNESTPRTNVKKKLQKESM